MIKVKLKNWWLLLLLLVTLLSGCQKKAVAKTPAAAPHGFTSTTNYAPKDSSQNSLRLNNFVRHNLLTKKGIYTNYLDTDKRRPDAATGHEMLSESSGLWLQYLASSHQWRQFRQFYQQTKQTFLKKGLFMYRYDPQKNKLFKVNATLDDLRIIRALLTYDEAKHTDHYRQEATERYQALLNTALRDGQLVDFYDVGSHQGANTASLAYFDMQTLKYFENTTKKGQHDYQRQMTVLKGGYLGDAFPLYANSYQWSSSKYSDDDLNTSEALETLLHLAEIGQLKATSRDWLVQRIQKRDLANGYSVIGRVSSDGESAANYALAAMIFAELHDQENYSLAMKSVWRLQINQPHSLLNGGIGDNKTQKIYSYNNLTALNASQR